MHRFLLLILLAAPLAAAEPKGIVFPSPPTPAPTPQPPGSALPVSSDRIFVVQLEADVVPIASGVGKVKFSVEQGPIRVRGVFVDGNGQYETRTLTAKVLVFVDPVSAGDAELFMFPVAGAKDESAIPRQRVTVLTGPQPPPPGPTPEPDRKTPIPGPGLKVMIVFENEQILAESQNSIIYGQKMRAYLNENCVDGGDGKKSFRIFDQNTPVIGDKQIWADAMKRPRTSVPWIVIGNETTGTEVPLPATVDETIKLIQKYGGK